MMPFAAAAVDLANANPGLAALVGSLVGAAAAASRGVRKTWRKEARAEARDVARSVVAEHVRTLHNAPALVRAQEG
jgi:hypothetical protein